MRACRFSSVTSSARAGEELGERVAVGIEHARDLDGVEAHPEPTGAVHRVLDALRRAEGRRHRDAAHRVGPQRVDRERCGDRGVDAAGQPEHSLMEAVLPDVVPEAEHQRPPDLFGVVGRPLRARVGERGIAVQVDDQQVLAEHRGSVAHRAVGRDHHRAAIEHELVLASDRVHVRDPGAGATRPRGQDLGALGGLASVVWRTVDVQDQRQARVARERLGVVPGVLAHRQTDRHPGHLDARPLGAGHEVALLVEDPEVRQLHLVVARLDGAVAQQRRRVVRPRVGTVDEPCDDRARGRRLARERVQRLEVLADELPAVHEVFGG